MSSRPPEQRRFRSSRGPRFSGRGVLAVFGLLGLLLTIAIMAVLAVKVLDGATGTGSSSVTAEGALVVPTAPSGGADTPPGGAPGAAAVCQANRDTLQTAIEAYQVLKGSPPPDVAALVAAGLLDTPVDTFTIRVNGATATLEGAGVCAGR